MRIPSFLIASQATVAAEHRWCDALPTPSLLLPLLFLRHAKGGPAPPALTVGLYNMWCTAGHPHHRGRYTPLCVSISLSRCYAGVSVYFLLVAEIIAYDGVVAVCPPISGRRSAACYGHLASLIPMEIGTAERRCGGKLAAQPVDGGHLQYRFCALSLGRSHCGR